MVSLALGGISRTTILFLLFLLAIPSTAWWHPHPMTSWQWQLDGTLDLSKDVMMFDVDLVDTTTSVIDQLHSQGKIVVCYFSAGSYEGWRPDADDFPSELLVKNLAGWNEKWLDISVPNVTLAAIMQARLDLAQIKGCDGVEPDNVDTYLNKVPAVARGDGTNVNQADQLLYNRFLTCEAHIRHLSIGMKNAMELIPQMLGDYDWALNEQCYQYDECDTLNPFVNAGKVLQGCPEWNVIHSPHIHPLQQAVFGVEYQEEGQSAATFCPVQTAKQYSWLLKKYDLRAWGVPCLNLSDNGPVCGDAVCSTGETAESCAADCGTVGAVEEGDDITECSWGDIVTFSRATATPTPTSTASPTPTSTASPTPTSTASPTPTSTASPTPTSTASPLPLLIPSHVPPSPNVSPSPSTSTQPLPSPNPTLTSGVWSNVDDDSAVPIPVQPASLDALTIGLSTTAAVLLASALVLAVYHRKILVAKLRQVARKLRRTASAEPISLMSAHSPPITLPPSFRGPSPFPEEWLDSKPAASGGLGGDMLAVGPSIPPQHQYPRGSASLEDKPRQVHTAAGSAAAASMPSTPSLSAPATPMPHHHGLGHGASAAAPHPLIISAQSSATASSKSIHSDRRATQVSMRFVSGDEKGSASHSRAGLARSSISRNESVASPGIEDEPHVPVRLLVAALDNEMVPGRQAIDGGRLSASFAGSDGRQMRSSDPGTPRLTNLDISRRKLFSVRSEDCGSVESAIL